jgi:hypothetical protein
MGEGKNGELQSVVFFDPPGVAHAHQKMPTEGDGEMVLISRDCRLPM